MLREFDINHVRIDVRDRENYPNRRYALVQSATEVVACSRGAVCIGAPLAQELIDTTNCILDGVLPNTDPEIIDSIATALAHPYIDPLNKDPMAIFVCSSLNLSHIHGSGKPELPEDDRLARFLQENGHWVSLWRRLLGSGVTPHEIEKYYLVRLRNEAIRGQGFPEIVRLAAERSDLIIRNIHYICDKLRVGMATKNRYDWV